MKRIKRWRYYCDFCKKAGGSSYHMQNHEVFCTNNPARQCRMCELLGVGPHEVSVLVQSLNGGLEGLRITAEGCPWCIWAAIKQSGLRQEEKWKLNFDFKAEAVSAMEEIRKCYN